MKYKTFTCPKLIVFALFPRGILFIILACLISNDISDIFTLIAYWCITNFFISSFISLFYRNAFVVVSIDEIGISNKHIALNWGEISNIETVTVKLLEHSLLPTIEIDLLCFSCNNKKKNFLTSNKDCIFVAKTNKNLGKIREAQGLVLCPDEKQIRNDE